MADERNPLDAQVTEVQSAAQKLVRALEAATRDVAASSEWAVRNIEVPPYAGGRAGGAGGAGAVEAENAAMARRNALDAEALAIDQARLRVLQEQNTAMGLGGRPQIIMGAAPYRPGGGQASVVEEATAQRAAAESQIRQAAIMQGVRAPYAQRATGDTAASRQLEAERQLQAELAREQQEVVRLIELYGEKATQAQSGIRAILDENAALVEQGALIRRNVTEWAAQGQAHPAVVRQTLEDLNAGQFGAGSGLAAPGGSTRQLFPITQVRPGPSALTEFDAYAGQLGSQRNMSQAANDLQRLSSIQAEASQTMYKHGALTTEWLQALGRGEVTVRDFGNQIALTGGKFAGWTIAAAGVFGLLGALKQVTEGAKEAQNASANLGRFIPSVNTPQGRDAAQSGVIDIASQLNVPMKDVSDTVVQFARVTKGSLPDALDATRTALLATKLDSVSTADSVRYFTSMMQELGKTGHDLPDIFDQISNAQRRLGARSQELLPALARSMGANRVTGGDFNQLMALEGAAIVLTGQTGARVGTAFSQGASQYYRRPQSRQIEEQFGLDPSQGFSQFVLEAIQRSQTLKPAQRLDLAKAMFGPRGAGGWLATLLSHPETVQQFQGATAPGASQGSALDELQHKLTSVDEILKSFPRTLQTIGAEITRTGAGMGLGVALETLKLILTSMQQLLHLFNDLPQSVRPWVALLLEASAAMAFTRETRIGGAIASATRLDRLPGFGRSPQNVARDEFLTGANAQTQMLANMREQTANQAAITSARRAAALDVANQNRILAEEATNETERDRLLQEANTLERRAAELKAEQNQLEQLQATYETRRLETIATTNAVKRRAITVQEAGNVAQTATSLEQDAAGAAAVGGSRSGARFVTDSKGVTTELVGSGERLGTRTGSLFAGLFARGFLATAGEVGFAILGAQMAADILQKIEDHFHIALPGSHGSAYHPSMGGVPLPQPGPSPGGHTGPLAGVLDAWDTLTGQGPSDPTPPAAPNLLADPASAILGFRPRPKPQVPTLYQWLQSLSEKQLIDQGKSDAERVANYAGTVGQGSIGTDSLTNLRSEYRVALDRAKTNPTSGNLNTLKQIQDDINTGIIQPTTQALSDALALSSSPAARDQAYAQALNNLKNAPGRAGQVARQQVRTQQFQEHTQNYDAMTSYLQSTTTDPLQQARTQQQRDEARLPAMQDAYNRGLISYTDFWGYMAKINADRQKTMQAVLDDFTQQQSLADAQFALSVGGDQGQILQHAVSDAEGLVGKIQAMGANAPHGAMMQAQTQLLNAQLALLQYNRQQAQQMWDANFQAQHVADAGDPVAAARDTLTQDIHDQRYAQGPGAQAQQRAKVRQDRYNLQQATIQSDYQNAQFEHQIGMLSDQAYIGELRKILNMKNISKQTRQQLLAEIYQVNQSAGQNLELNVGQIKLPTLYDVRRAAAAGAASQGRSFGAGNTVVSHAANMSFEINILHPSDASTVYKAIEDATGTSLQGSLRAAGVV